MKTYMKVFGVALSLMVSEVAHADPGSDFLKNHGDIVTDMRALTQAVIQKDTTSSQDNTKIEQAKKILMEDIRKTSTSGAKGTASKTKLLTDLNNFDGNVLHMKTVWEDMSDFTYNIDK